MPKLSIIIPCYYSEHNIPVTTKELIENEKVFPSDVEFEYIMVDDGSKDNTIEKLKEFKNQHPNKVKIVKLSGNFGSYNAIQAGMKYAEGDVNVVIAVDLQDPPELMLKMYNYWLNGIKLVVANRNEREDSFLARLFAKSYQKLIQKFALPNLPNGGFDYCLFDRQLKDQVIELNENNTNSLYLLMWLKYDFVSIPYTRRKRSIGKSRWTLKKKIKLFVDSFVSFSYAPLRLITISGLLLGLISFIYAIYVVFARLSGVIDVQGWTTMMVVFLVISSFQMISIGIIGEYLWRSLESSRKRPPYVIDQVI
ncbi:MAG: glycosyltransferase family 2 protein [Bacteroidia bacterium]|jgi:glycosyltransferase involved in cell wall biosynthesis|nr:glycosyltransferase family 2 protein [Bacteroidia bacterium]